MKCLLLTILLLLFVNPTYLTSAAEVTQPPQDTQIAFLQPDPVAAENLYQEWINAKRNKMASYNVCSCVSYAKWRSGINVGSIGVAKNHPVNANLPQVGAIVVQTIDSANYRNTGHLSVVESVNNDDTITVSEANYKHCSVSKRIIPINSPNILGYYVLQ